MRYRCLEQKYAARRTLYTARQIGNRLKAFREILSLGGYGEDEVWKFTRKSFAKDLSIGILLGHRLQRAAEASLKTSREEASSGASQPGRLQRLFRCSKLFSSLSPEPALQLGLRNQGQERFMATQGEEPTATTTTILFVVYIVISCSNLATGWRRCGARSVNDPPKIDVEAWRFHVLIGLKGPSSATGRISLSRPQTASTQRHSFHLLPNLAIAPTSERMYHGCENIILSAR